MEREKLLSGLEYGCTDTEIQGLPKKCALRSIVPRRTKQPRGAWRSSIRFLPVTTRGSPFRAFCGARKMFGSYVFINPALTLQGGGRITTGDRPLIAPNVSIRTGDHSLGVKERRKKAQTANCTL